MHQVCVIVKSFFPPTAADKGECDDKGKNMVIFIHIPALWNGPCLPTAADKGVTF
jgi:hypothetical protein